MNPKNRISMCFNMLKNEKRTGLITFITAGDPDLKTSQLILEALPKAGSDIIELGVPFSDPMADGVVIQESYKRSLKKGHTLNKTLKMVREFRKNNDITPIILMGYFNPIHSMGVEKFLTKSKHSGVDGLIVVDLPPEADEELCIPAKKQNINFIRLASPTTNVNRIKKIIKNTSGFIYYISITGITGTITGKKEEIKTSINRIKKYVNLPVAVGFGINTPQKAKNIGKYSDAVVIGSAIVSEIAKKKGKKYDIVEVVSKLVSDYAKKLL